MLDPTHVSPCENFVASIFDHKYCFRDVIEEHYESYDPMFSCWAIRYILKIGLHILCAHFLFSWNSRRSRRWLLTLTKMKVGVLYWMRENFANNDSGNGRRGFQIGNHESFSAFWWSWWNCWTSWLLQFCPSKGLKVQCILEHLQIRFPLPALV